MQLGVLGQKACHEVLFFFFLVVQGVVGGWLGFSQLSFFFQFMFTNCDIIFY